MQVVFRNFISVDQRDLSHPGAGQVLQYRHTQPARAHDKHMRTGQLRLPLATANFVQGSIFANATSNLRGYFLTGPLILTLIAIVLTSIIYSLWMELRHSPYATEDEVVAREGSG